jgi:natural product biosynthesis luciferase-like monooxygenase protein/amino acid adenylation domain-containing protein
MSLSTLDTAYELSPMQQGMLFHNLYAPLSGVFVQQTVCSLHGELDVAAFRSAWDRVIDRHPILRSSFRWEGVSEPVHDARSAIEFPIAVQDWNGLPPKERDYRLETYLHADRRRGFELGQAPLMRVALFRTETEWLLVWTSHHALLDGRSRLIVLKEVFLYYQALCEGTEPELPPPPTFDAYIRWLRAQDLGAAERYWRELMRGFTAPTPFVVSRPVGGMLASEANYAEQRIRLSEGVTSALRSLAVRHQLTLHTLVKGAWALLLSRYSGEQDVVFGDARARGRTAVEGGESMIGLFLNTVPIRARVAPDAPLGAWLTELQAQQTAAREFEHAPLSRIQDWSDVPRDVPLFESLLLVESGVAHALRSALGPHSGRQEFRSIEQTNYPLTLFASIEPDVVLRISYDRHRFDDPSIMRMLGHLQTLLEGMAGDPERRLADLPLLTNEERQQLLEDWNDTVRDRSQSLTIHEMIAQQADRHPDAVALLHDGSELTFQELNRRANQLAHRLRREGLGPESLVALCAERSFDMVVGVLGILKAGAAYVPLDPAYPRARIAFMLEDAKADAVVTQRRLVQGLPALGVVPLCVDDETLADESEANPTPVGTPENLAYVMYTSGSTGKPKGVMVTHRNLRHYVQAMRAPLGITGDDRYLHTASIAFSSSVRQMMVPLSVGAAVIIASRKDVADPVALFGLIKDQGVTVIDLVPTYWQHCMNALTGLEPAQRQALLDNGIRLVLTASEPLPAELPNAWTFGLKHGARLINMFGQTETTGIVSLYPIPVGFDEGRIVHLGRPIANTKLYILDAHMQPVPIGVPGELCVGGEGVARGYLRRPDLADDKFPLDPFSHQPEARMYRTGDRARFRSDGNVEFIGRTDNQVKIRGHRVEVEEIEAALRNHEGVREVVVVAREATAGDRRLVAFVVPSGEPAPTVSDLRRALAARLPDYMIPSAFVLVESLPRTPNGKIERAALPATDLSLLELGNEFVAPRTAVEARIAAIWMEVLGVDRVGIEDNFFALGGHSLMGMRVMARVRQAFDVDIPLRRLFEAPTIARLAEAVETATRSAPGRAMPPIRAAAREGTLPLSFAQQRLWLLNQLEPDSAAYNLSAVIRMQGELDRAALERALSEIVRRHESLRTVFPSVDGTPSQVVQPPYAVSLTIAELGNVDASGADAEVARLTREEAARPFDLERGPLFRALLVRITPRDHLLVLTMHHIVSDGWSRGVLYREIGALYEAFAADRPSPLADLTVQYADYAQWQREWLQEDVLAEQLSYWTRQLAGPLPKLDLPTDHPRPAVQTFRGATHSFTLPPELVDALRTTSATEGATLFMALLAAFQALLARYSGQDDIIIGSPVAGRPRVELEELIGFFVNTLVMRGNLAGDPTFREVLARTREAALGAYANQDIPFERIVDAVHPERDLSRSPIFQVLFILQNTPIAPLALSELTLRKLDVDAGAAKFDITLSLVADESGYTGHLEYNTDLFDATTIERMAGHFITLLDGVAANPELRISQLPVLTRGEQRRMLEEWNDTRTVVPADECIHHQFEAQVARTPNAVAVVFEADELTYKELDARANQLAHALRKLGVGPDVLVAVFAERSIEMMVALLGIHKAGGAYVPLDPTYPKGRLAFMLADSGAPVVLTQRRLLDRLPEHNAKVVCLDRDWDGISREREEAPARESGPNNLAYMIYTSGSTGKPKGVMIEHRNVVNFFAGMDERLGGDVPGTWLAVTSISFDISVLELFWTLTRGFKVVIQAEQDASRLAAQASEPFVDRKIDFSLFYFASNEQTAGADKYRLLMEGAKFADAHGFEAVWTPERHFHSFGGLYPNAAVTSAAIAAITKNVKIRAGSVVLPLHNPLRVAEEWSLVDNISSGRVGIAIASGWHDRDFAFAPDNYARRREVIFEYIETVRKLWRGESVTTKGGSGKDVEVRTFPRPVQKHLPIWITAAGTPETFRKAGEIGANLLTHLLGQKVEQLAERVALYRQAWRDAGHPGEGHVTLMMHTFVGGDMQVVKDKVRGPFREYLRTSVDLIKDLAEGRGQDIRSTPLTPEDWDALLDHGFHRYFDTSALMGTPDTCVRMVNRLKGVGIDEIACLIDFGVDEDSVLESLDMLANVRERSARDEARDAEKWSVAAQLARHQVTHLQCTPSMASMLLAQDDARAALGSLVKLMIGGEAFPPTLATALQSLTGAEIVNMYGPTETTIWSSTYQVNGDASSIPIGQPIANTEFYIVDRHLQPVPIGIPGELLIGGAGVVRGYFNRDELTTERFVPNPFRPDGGRLYRTGDLARYRADGVVDFLGRIDHQVKIRGHRIELGEIEAVVAAQPGVREAVVVAREDSPGDKRLVAYVVAVPGELIDQVAVREALKTQLPDYMVPSHVMVLDALPLTPNAKIDRKALPAPESGTTSAAAPTFVSAESDLERTIAGIWQEILNVPRVGVQDNFFDIGGHSLLTVRVHSRLRAAVDRQVSLTDLFRFPTIRSLAKHMGGGAGATVSVVEESLDRAETRRQAMMRRRRGPAAASWEEVAAPRDLQ